MGPRSGPVPAGADTGPMGAHGRPAGRVDTGLELPSLLIWLDRTLARAGVNGRFPRDLVLGVVWATFTVALLLPMLGPFAAELGMELATAEIQAVLVVVALQSLLLCLRRIRPVTCLLLVAAGQLVLAAVMPDQTNLRVAAPLVAAYTCGTCLPLGRLFRWLGVAVLLEVAGGAAVTTWLTGAVRTLLFGARSSGAADPSGGAGAGVVPRFEVVLLGAVLVLLLYLAAGIAGVAVAGRRDHLILLQERAEDAEWTQQARAQSAVDAERARMARELHDIAAHHLSGLVVQAAAAERLIDRSPDAAKLAVQSIRLLGKDALASLRLVVGVLRERETVEVDGGSGKGQARPTEESGAPVPGLEVLDRLVASAHELGDDVEMIRQGHAHPLAPVADVTAYRVVQESLANARRHAPGAPVRVLLDHTRPELRVTVQNAAPRRPGPTEARPGFGLLGMRERAQLAGGRLTAGPSGDGGWRVELRIPGPAARPDAGPPALVEESRA